MIAVSSAVSCSLSSSMTSGSPCIAAAPSTRGERGRCAPHDSIGSEDRPVSVDLVNVLANDALCPFPEGWGEGTVRGLSGWTHGSSGGARVWSGGRVRASAGAATPARLARHALRARPQVPARALGLPGLRRHRRRRQARLDPRGVHGAAVHHRGGRPALRDQVQHARRGVGRRAGRRRRGPRPARPGRHPCDGLGGVRLQLQPAPDGLPRRGHPLRHPQGRRAAHRRARLPGPPDRAPSVRLEGPQVGAGRGVYDRRPPRLLGGARLPQHRRPLEGTALLLPGGTGRRPGAVRA
ncbi:exported hypothetical protein [Streptomyces misionensis JCM 4497]